MVVPGISHETWLKVAFWTQICVGSETSTDDFSFEQRIQTLLDWDPWGRVSDMNDGGDYYLKDIPRGHTKKLKISNPDRIHRPEVSEETADRLREWADSMATGPIEAYDFEEQVECLLHGMDKYGKKVDIKVKVA